MKTRAYKKRRKRESGRDEVELGQAEQVFPIVGQSQIRVNTIDRWWACAGKKSLKRYETEKGGNNESFASVVVLATEANEKLS